MGKRLCVVCCVVFAATATGAAAQTGGPLRLSLQDAQDRAQAASHRLAEGRARAAAAEGLIAVRRAADRPIAALVSGYTRTNHVTEFVVPGPTGVPRVLYPDVPDNYRARLDLQWPIYNGGRSDALERAAGAEAMAAGAEVAVTQADLRLEVARAYWALVTSRATVSVLEQSLSRAQAHRAVTRERLRVGLVPPNEVASAEALESRQRMLLIEARNQQALSSAVLARLVAVDLVQPIEPTDALDVPTEASSSLDALVALARTTRDERGALEARIEAAEQQRTAAERVRRPTVAMSGGLDYARPNPRIFPRSDRWNESWDAGVNVAWSLWDGGRARAEAGQAAALATAGRARLAEFDSVLTLELHERLLDIDSGRAAIVASNDTVRAASEARRVVAERYQVGVSIQTEVLDAESTLLQAELDRTRDMAGLKLAEARLSRAVGR